MAMYGSQILVGQDSTLIIPGNNAGQSCTIMRAEEPKKSNLFLGSSEVTPEEGFLLPSETPHRLELAPKEELYGAVDDDAILIYVLVNNR